MNELDGFALLSIGINLASCFLIALMGNLYFLATKRANSAAKVLYLVLQYVMLKGLHDEAYSFVKARMGEDPNDK